MLHLVSMRSEANPYFFAERATLEVLTNASDFSIGRLNNGTIIRPRRDVIIINRNQNPVITSKALLSSLCSRVLIRHLFVTDF